MRIRHLKYFIVLPTLLFFAAPAAAQQETRQVAPETRNPQNNAGLPNQQQPRDVQATGTEQVLSQNVVIQIPDGEPAADATAASRQQNQRTRLLWLISGFSLLAAGVCFAWLRRSRPVITDSVSKEVMDVGEEALKLDQKTMPKKTVPKPKSKTRKKRKRKV